MKSLLSVTLLAALALLDSGCASYIAPGPKADLQQFATPEIQAAFAAEPTRPFPAGIAAVRIQAPNYQNEYLRRNSGVCSSGRYTVITVREVEEPDQLERVTSLPQVAGVTGLNRMLLPTRITGDRELREAAARAHADLLFLYTFDTHFWGRNTAKPLSVITLGLSPTRKITATTTASALLLDTRTGYLYSAYEATDRQAALSTSWSTRDSADAVRQKTEKAAFSKLIDQVVASWPRLLRQYGAADGSNRGESPRNSVQFTPGAIRGERGVPGL